ncbi:LysR family transcriptional regulator [Bdellovibrio sp. HCB337]|uniref:LysR family transcriptional regulator n=1 Tax=Bdellovibrio sp. HCB337 TaxID=3394358 RepID=UPI0039A4C0B6
MVNWNFLETFIILSENLSFSETARVLNTAQPVISRQIKTLEESLGYSLFLRTKKRVLLSQEGQDLKLRLSPLVDEIRTLLLEKQAPGQLMRGTIRIGSMYEAGEKILFPTIAKCIEQNPGLQIHTTLMPTTTANEMILKGLLDFAFVYQVADRKSIKAFPVYSDLPVMVVDKKVAKSWGQRGEILMIGYRERDLYTEHFLERHLSKSDLKKVRIVASVNSHAKMLELVRKQNLAAVMPYTSAIEAESKGQVEVVLRDKKVQELYIICNEQVLIDKKKKMFLDFILKEFAKKSQEQA